MLSLFSKYLTWGQYIVRGSFSLHRSLSTNALFCLELVQITNKILSAGRGIRTSQNPRGRLKISNCRKIKQKIIKEICGQTTPSPINRSIPNGKYREVPRTVGCQINRLRNFIIICSGFSYFQIRCSRVICYIECELSKRLVKFGRSPD